MRIIGHGIDIVEVSRISEMLAEHGQRFLDRCFTPGEQAYAADRKGRDEHLAVRFAAKEAVLKAIGTGWRDGIAWTDVEVVPEPSGRPTVRLHGEAARLAREAGISAWFISLSHTRALAQASVIAAG